MIPILYNSWETFFTSNGLGRLSDAMLCDVKEVLNGEYELLLTYPNGGIHYDELVVGNIIHALASHREGMQPFRIYRTTQELDGTSTIYARHIRYDLDNTCVMPFSAANAGAALALLKASAVTDLPFAFVTDITTEQNISVDMPCSTLTALLAADGFKGVYNSELHSDKYRIALLAHRGFDNGVNVKFGKNLVSLMREFNTENITTAVMPFWVDAGGNIKLLPERYIETTKPHTELKISPYDTSPLFETEPSYEEMRAKAIEFLETEIMSEPFDGIDFSFFDLKRSEEYADLAYMQDIELGDTVRLIYEDAGINLQARCTSLLFDSLNERSKELHVGAAQNDLEDVINRSTKDTVENRLSRLEFLVRNMHKIIDHEPTLDDLTGINGTILLVRGEKVF